jgi:putative endonuclease
MNNTKKTGSKGEAFALDYLLSQGFVFRGRNYHSRYGEIDIILEKNEYIVFVEVKTRKPSAACRGVEAVSKNKKLRIIKTAVVYLLNNPSKKQPRFDVTEVIVNRKGIPENLNHFENAFDLEGFNAFF